MATTRPQQVHESLEELRELERVHRNTPREVRIRMLRRIKEETLGTFVAFAAESGYSVPNVNRWWKAYRSGGIEELLAIRAVKRAGKSDAEAMKELLRKLDAGALTSLDDLQHWIDSKQKSARPAGTNKENNEKQRAAVSLPEHIIRVLNTLSVDAAPILWINVLRNALMAFFPDVDWILIAPNLDCDLLDPKNYRPDVATTQDITSQGHERERVRVRIDKKLSHQQRLLEDLDQQKYPLKEYHPLTGFDYYFAGTAYMGTIFLMRYHYKTPISTESSERMRSLYECLVFIFSDYIARQYVGRPAGPAFNRALAEFAREHRLTRSERRILTLQFIGYDYQQIMTSANISINTVRTQVQAIHRKTGTSTLADLIAKCFSHLISSSIEPGDTGQK